MRSVVSSGLTTTVVGSTTESARCRDAAGEAQHRHQPGEHDDGQHTESDRNGTTPTRTQAHGGQPQGKQQHQHRLAHPACEAEEGRREPRIRLAALERAEGEEGDQRRKERLAGVRQPDGAVEPEERADGQEGGRRERGRPVVRRASQRVHDERRESAEEDGERDIGRGRIIEPGVHEAAQADIEDVARRVWLVLDHVVLAQRERELHGVPVVRHARAIRQP